MQTINPAAVCGLFSQTMTFHHLQLSWLLPLAIGMVALIFIMSRVRSLRRQLLQSKQNAEKHLVLWQENQRCLQLMIDYMSDTVLLFDPQSRIVAINKKGEQLFGYKAYELVGQSVHKLLAPKSNDDTRQWEKQGMAGTIIIHGLCKNGQSIALELSLISGQRQPGTCIGILRNMAEQKTLKMALQTSEERFHAIFDNAAIGMALVGIDGAWLKVNRALCTMMGYGESELLPTLSAVTYLPDQDAHTPQQTSLLNGEIDAYEMEKRFYHREGHLIWVLLSQSVIRDTFGLPKYFVVQVQDINRQKNAESRLIYQSKHDTLTGLLNRQQIEHDLQKIIPSATLQQNMVAVLCIDLDHFRKVNERFGNDIGDLLLQRIAECLKTNISEKDLVGRVGGDKFVVVFTGIHIVANVILPVEKIISAVHKPVYIKNYKLFNTISVGISFFPEDGTDSRQLIDHANIALQQAKKAGGDRFRFYNPEILSVV